MFTFQFLSRLSNEHRNVLKLVKNAMDHPSIEALLGLVYASCCQICERARAVRSKGFVCGQCQRRIVRIEQPYCGKCGLPYAGEISDPFTCMNCRTLRLAFDWARAAVVADQRNATLVAFVVASQEVDARALKRELSRHLPANAKALRRKYGLSVLSVWS